jgi:hypothetical protein
MYSGLAFYLLLKLNLCEGLKLDLYSIELGHKLCTKSLEEERDGSSRIAEEVVRRAVAEREQAIWQGHIVQDGSNP